ncbi:MAG TPA: glycoside hydrolase family 3 C-terminal domain-containing protein [Candidatus Baltobacteraceae bacterium]
MSRWLARSLAIVMTLAVVPAAAGDVARGAQALARTGSAPAAGGVPALRLATPDPALASAPEVAAAWDPAAWRAYGAGLAAGARAAGANAVAIRLGAFSNDPAFEALAVGPIFAGLVRGHALAVAVPSAETATDPAAIHAQDQPPLEAAVRGGAGAIACTLPAATWVAAICRDPHLLAATLRRQVAFQGFVTGSSWTDDTTIERVRWAARKAGLLGRPPLPGSPAATATLSRRLVQSGAVLLKNDGFVLPFAPEAVRSLVVVGADDATLAAIRAALPRTAVTTAPADPVLAAQAAARVTACVLILGAPSDGEAELVRALAAANPRTAVVLERGPEAIDWSAQAPAVLVAWDPVAGTPEGLANVLTGLAAPAGRLPSAAAGYPLGAGTTYAVFAYSGLRIDYGHGSEAPVTVSFLVGNAGVRAGTAVARLMLVPPGGGPARLAAFARVTLAAGQSRRVRLPLAARVFAVWSPAYDAWYVAPGAYAATVLDAAVEPALSGTIRIVSR